MIEVNCEPSTESYRDARACPGCGAEQSFSEPNNGYARCGSCGVLQNQPFPTDDDIIAHYLQTSTSGNYAVKAISVFDSIRKNAYRNAIQKLQTTNGGTLRGKNVLDVGCFTGLSLEVLQEEHAVPFGIELQEEAAQIAAAKFPGRVQSCDICHKLPFRESFAAITLTDVIEHLSDPLAALQSLAGALDAGGHILFTTPDTGSLVARLLGPLWPSRCPVHHIYLFNRANIARLLDRADFEIVHCSPLWKRYSLDYVIWIMPNLSPALGKVVQLIPRWARKLVLPLNGGEMLVVARKR